MTTKKTCVRVFRVALFIIVPKLERIQMHQRNGWVFKWWCIHTLEHYTALKKNRVLIDTTVWLSFTGVALRDRS